MGETLRRKLGPLPVWAWALVFVLILVMYLKYRQNKAAAANANAPGGNLSSNLGTVPVSNLTTQAQPMPIQLGDTFVSTSVPVSTSTTTTLNNPGPPSTTMQPPPVPPAPNPPAPPATNPNPTCYGTAPNQTCFSGPPKQGYGYCFQNGQWNQCQGSGIGYQPLPGQGAGVAQLFQNNPQLGNPQANIPGITGYQVSYNGVPI